MGNDFLDTNFSLLDIGDCTITLHCTNYMFTTSLTYDPVHDYYLIKMVVLAAMEISYKKF